MYKTALFYDDHQEKRKKIILVILLLLLLFGIYKNGLQYLSNNLVLKIDIFKLFLYPIISFIGVLGYSLLKKEKITIDNACEAIILALLVPPRFPLIIYSIIIFGYFLLKSFNYKCLETISLIVIYKVILILVGSIIHLNNLNLVELNHSYHYGILNNFFGYSVGDLGTTNIVLIIILLITMCSSFYYKKELVFYLLLPFFIWQVINVLLLKELNTTLLQSTYFLASILIAPLNGKSPGSKKEIIIFGLGISLLSIVLDYVLKSTNSIYIALLIFQILWTISLRIRKEKS